MDQRAAGQNHAAAFDERALVMLLQAAFAKAFSALRSFSAKALALLPLLPLLPLLLDAPEHSACMQASWVQLLLPTALLAAVLLSAALLLRQRRHLGRPRRVPRRPATPPSAPHRCRRS